MQAQQAVVVFEICIKSTLHYQYQETIHTHAESSRHSNRHNTRNNAEKRCTQEMHTALCLCLLIGGRRVESRLAGSIHHENLGLVACDLRGALGGVGRLINRVGERLARIAVRGGRNEIRGAGGLLAATLVGNDHHCDDDDGKDSGDNENDDQHDSGGVCRSLAGRGLAGRLGLE